MVLVFKRIIIKNVQVQLMYTFSVSILFFYQPNRLLRYTRNPEFGTIYEYSNNKHIDVISEVTKKGMTFCLMYTISINTDPRTLYTGTMVHRTQTTKLSYRYDIYTVCQ